MSKPKENNPGTPRVIEREFYADGIILREANGEGSARAIEGYALVFNTESLKWDLGDGEYIVEVIPPSALSADTVAASDVCLTMFHNDEILLARSDHGTGTLSLSLDDHGLKFSAELPDTADGDKAYQAIKRGDVKGCSFRGRVRYADELVSEVDAEGKIKRTATIEEITELFDVTLTPKPAYPDTSVIARQFNLDAKPEAAAPAEPEAPAVEAAEEPEAETPAETETPSESECVERTAEAPAPAPKAVDPEAATAAANVIQRNLNPENKPNTQTAMAKKTLTTIVREVVEQNKRGEFIITRAEGGSQTPSTPTTETPSTTTVTPLSTTEVTAGGLMPIRVQEIIAPLVAGLIWDKLGIKVSYSQSGELVWPVRGTAKTQIVGEKVAVAPQTIDLSKITMRPERFSCSVECTYESLYQSENAVEEIIRTAMAESIQKAINDLELSTSKVEGAASIVGPLVAAYSKATTLSAVTLKEFLTKAKAPLMKKGIDASKTAFTMSEATKARLEGTTIDTGSGRFLIENDKLAGFPVYTTDAIADNVVGLGDWSNQAAAFFGDMRMIVNPYSGDTANVIRFTLNFGFGTVTLRPDAFIVVKLPAES